MESTGVAGEFHERLSAVRKKQDVASLIRGVAFTVGVLLCAILFSLILEQIVGFGVTGRTILACAFLLLAVSLLLLRIGGPLGRLAGILPGESDLRTARTVGLAIPALSDRLVNALELLADRDTRTIYSGDLVEASLEDLRNSSRGMDFAATVDRSGSRTMGRFMLLTTLAAVLLFAIFPSAFFGAAGRLIHFNEAFADVPRFRFVVEPGTREVIKGETVDVRIRVLGDQPGEITLAWRRRGDLRYEEEVLQPDNAGGFHRRFAPVNETTEYYVHARSIRGEDYTLAVMDRPLVRMVRVTVIPPAYSGLPTRQQDDNVGDVTALRGSRIRFDIEANKELMMGRLSLSDSAVLPLEVGGKRARASLVLMKERTYHIDLADSAGTMSTDPVEYTMKVIPDAFPAVTLLAPGENLDITDTTPVDLLAKVNDDFGFSRIRLAYKLVQSKYEKPAQDFTFVNLPRPPAGSIEALVPYRWTIAGLRLVPEDVVSYYMEVFDNDVISGPKSALSEIFSLRLPSMDEVFAQADRGHETSIEGMREALKKAQEARKEMEDLTQSVRASADKVEWQDRQKAGELLKKYDEVRAKMDSVKGAVDKMVGDLSKNQVLSKETLEKYQELQHMMAEMSSPEFAEAMKQLQQAMQQMSPDALRQAMQQFSASEETFRKSIERTLNLLKRIQIEQKVDEAVKRNEQMLKQQDRLNEETRRASADDRQAADRLLREQKEVKEQADSLGSQMESLQKKMEEFPSEMPLAELERARQDMAADSLHETMEEISRDMEQMHTEQAARGQKQAMSSMNRLGQHLQKMQQDMKQNQERQVLGAMRRSMRDLLDLSRREEALKNEAASLEPNSRRFRDNEEAQMDVMRDLGTVAEQLSALSQKTFGVTPEMGKSIGDAMRNMNEAMRSLAQRNRPGAAQQQTDAMGSLNDAAQKVEDSMNSMQQSGGGGMGMAGLMQRLRRLSSQQGGINDATRNLGAMTPAQAADMARLAGEQGMVRKSLEQLAREAASTGELKKLMGDLNAAAREMADVQTDLMTGNFNSGTAQKEDRILSRLLDAQRSTRERDFEKKRTSTAGRDVSRESPPVPDLTTVEGRNRLRRDLQKALDEGYAREYEDLIRRYFEILEQSESHAR